MELGLTPSTMLANQLIAKKHIKPIIPNSGFMYYIVHVLFFDLGLETARSNGAASMLYY